MIQELLKHITHTHHRPYKGGVEIRFMNLDQGKESVEKIIKSRSLPIEIFNVDIRLRSIADRAVAPQSHESPSSH